MICHFILIEDACTKISNSSLYGPWCITCNNIYCCSRVCIQYGWTNRHWLLGIKTKMVVIRWLFLRFYRALRLNENENNYQKMKTKMVKNMKTKMKVIWASSDRFREISYFCGILPYFIDRNTIFTYNVSTPCYLYS